MPHGHFKKIVIILLIPFISQWAALYCYSEEAILFICHPNVTDTSLTERDLLNIYTGKKNKWSDNKKIKLAVLKPGSETSRTFFIKCAKKSPVQFSNYWRNMLFTGKGIPPSVFSDEDKMVAYVSSTEGAIGFVSTGKSSDKVKTIEIKWGE